MTVASGGAAGCANALETANFGEGVVVLGRTVPFAFDLPNDVLAVALAGPAPPPPEDEATAEETVLSPVSVDDAGEECRGSEATACGIALPPVDQCTATYWRSAADNGYVPGPMGPVLVVDETQSTPQHAVQIATALVHFAWTLMNDNLDLLKWALCVWSHQPHSDEVLWLATCEPLGYDSFFECVLDGFAEGIVVTLADADTVGFADERVCGKGDRAAMWSGDTTFDLGALAGLSNGKVVLCLNQRLIDVLVTLATSPHLAAAVCGVGDEGALLFECLALDLGVIMVHEVLHGCGVAHGASDEGGRNCTADPVSRLNQDVCAMGSFRYALAKRYEPMSICCRFMDSASGRYGASFTVAAGPCGKLLFPRSGGIALKPGLAPFHQQRCCPDITAGVPEAVEILWPSL